MRIVAYHYVSLYFYDAFTWQPWWPLHFKEDVLRVKRSLFRIVILSGAKDLCPARDPSLRSELALERSEGMTKPDGLFFRNVLPTRECPYTSYVYLKSCYRGSIWRRFSAR